MTRGRDSTNAGARSPRLAITLRGLKILEHPKTKPELWGVVVPWVRVRVVADRAQLFDEFGARIDSPRRHGVGWCMPSCEGRIARRMAWRARKRAVDMWDFKLVQVAPVDRQTRCLAIVGLVLGVGAFPALIGVLAAMLYREGTLATWHGVVAASLMALVFGLPMPFAAAALYSELRVVWVGARRVECTPEAIEMHFDGGQVVRRSWQSIRRVSLAGRSAAIVDDEGQKYWLPDGCHAFLLAAHASNLDPMRGYRRSPKAAVVREFVIGQLCGILTALVLLLLKREDPDIPAGLPLVAWLLGGVVLPAMGALLTWLDLRTPRKMGAWRRRLVRRRPRPAPGAPANPAG